MMKKFFVLCFILIVSSLYFACSKDEVDGKDDWVISLEKGKEIAQADEKNIILLVTSDDDDYSAKLKDAIFFRRSFIDTYAKKFVLVNLDFSTEFVEGAYLNQDDFELAQIINVNMKDASLYMINMTPSVYVLSKEGYCIAQILLTSETTSVKEFNSLFELAQTRIDTFESMLEKTYSSEKEERLAAIREIADFVDEDKLHLLRPLLMDYISLDEDNSTGLRGKYLLACCDYEALQLFYFNQWDKGCDIYKDAALMPHLTGEDRQLLYYQAGFFMAASGLSDYEWLKSIFVESLDAAPNSQYADGIKEMIALVDDRIKNP